MKRLQRIFIAACGFALSATALAAPVSNSDASYLKRATPRFETFAGSSDNLSSLASGLRSGTPITLTGDGQKVTFTSPTRPMGYGNITRALDLAQRQLAAQGITNPTPSQLQTALMGGTITGPKGTVTYAGVLQLRSSGMGWGQIAHSIGVHPGLGKVSTASSSASGITSAAGGRVSATGKSNASHAGGSANAHGSGRGLGTAATVTTAAGAGAGGAASAGGGHGNAFGRGK